MNDLNEALFHGLLYLHGRITVFDVVPLAAFFDVETTKLHGVFQEYRNISVLRFHSYFLISFAVFHAVFFIELLKVSIMVYSNDNSR